MEASSVLSIFFSAANVLYLLIGIYALYLNPRNKTNIQFFALTVALGLWSFGFSMAISSDNIDTVLFWRRFAALGFGAFFSILLHLFLSFTGHITSCRRKWACSLLYLPTVVVYLGFTYFPQLNPEQYNMISTPLGWINIAVNNPWDVFYILYYVLYTLAALYLVWQWGRASRSPRNKKQSRLILISFLATILIGSLTDMFGTYIFNVNIPQLSPLLMTFPALVIYYSIKRHGFLNPKQLDEDAILMSDQIRKKIMNHVSIAFLFASFMNMVVSYVLADNFSLGEALTLSGLLIVIGAVLQVIQRFIKGKILKDFLIAAIFALLVPLLTLRLISTASVTIWAFPFILLIVTLVFKMGFIQILLTVSILLTQIVVWLISPEATLTVDNSDHVVRLGIFIIAIWFAHFVRQVLLSKLKENAEQISFQKAITEISTELISVNEQNLEQKTDRVLSKLGNVLKPSHAYIYIFDEKKESLKCQGYWTDHTVTTDAGITSEISASNYPLLTTQIKEGNPIILADISNFSKETGNELPQLLGSCDKSFVAMPIIIKNQTFGFLGLDANMRIKKWPETKLSFSRIISFILADAYEKILYEKEITYMAYYDYLTKLPNRMLFRDRTAQAINLSERTNRIFAVVFMDMDAFKTVNDSIGHKGGDTLLIMVADKLKKCIRKSDTLSRFGGDDFLILLNNLSSTDDIPKIIDKIYATFDNPFNVNGQDFHITASAGIAVYPFDGNDPETLIKNADHAMYKSKDQGKNRYLFYTADMEEDILRKMQLTNSLYRVLERQELQLYYQPQVRTKSEKIIGVEALLRWFHPEFGVVSPGLFIPLAEQTGLIGPIGDWVLRTACIQCRTWHSKGLSNIRVAVNVSILQLRDPKFVQRVGRILKETQLQPQYLELEVTESAAVAEFDYVIKVLNDLKKLGISISIDDFGTKYSSLSRLCTMPIDSIKLDMQFVQSIDRSEKDNAIIKGIIDIAHTLGLNIIAEGVETQSQLDFLSVNHADEIQGYYFFRPLPSDEVEKLL